MALNRPVPPPKTSKPRTPFVEAIRIAAPYFIIGCLWILFSDRLLVIPKDTPSMMLLSILKGLFYVLVTAVLVFLLVHARAKRLWHYNEHLEDMIRERTAEYEKAQKEALDYSREKDRALERMKHLSAFNGIFLHLAQEFINMPVEEISDKINDALRRIGQYLGEDSIFLAEYDYDHQVCNVTHRWSKPRPGITPGANHASSFNPIQEMLETHQRGWPYHIPDTTKVHNGLAGLLSATRIMSFIAIPVLSKGDPFGFIGIGSIGAEKAWQEDDLAMLHIFAGLIQNVFEQRERETLLQENSRNMRVLLDSTEDGIFLINRAGKIIDLNTAAAGLLQRSVEDSVGKPLAEVMPGSIMDQRGYAMWETLKTGQPNRFIGLRDGMWIDTRYFPVFDPDGYVTAVATFSTNITERVNAENEIYKSRQMLQQVIENASVGIYWRDADNRVLGVNRVITEVTGLSSQELAEGKGDRLLPISVEDGLADDDMQILNSGKAKLNYEANLVNAQNVSRILKMSKIPLLDKDSRPYALLGVVEDVTEQKRMIQDLIAARQEAFDASKAKSAFLSMMSHEIRTPMNSIIGLTHIARHAAEPVQVAEYLGQIDTASKHLLGIINDILDLSRIEAGKMTLNNTDFDFESFMEETVGIVQPKADEKKQTLDVYMDSAIPPRLHADSLRLRQVLVNLATNAVKFTPGYGAIVIRANLESQENGQLTLRFSVTDNGIGIAADKLASLFNPFEQLDKNITREHMGTGLGLAISKNIVDMMGGAIGVRSQLGMGSEFFFTAPMQAAESGGQPSYMHFSQLNALVVDDEQETCAYMASMLSSFSIRFDTATSGNEAIQKALEATRAGMPYNVAFIDWRMPGLNGIETASEVKRICGVNTRVIMISKFDMDEVMQQMKAAGIKLFLPKPIFPNRLLGVLNEVTNSVQAMPAQTEKSIQGSFAGKRIMVVEDMEINQMIIREMLRETGVEILAAMDGNQAQELFHSQGESIGAILMDVQMPGKDGYAATREIRASALPNAQTVPIIAMTANVFKEDVEAAALAGMNGHIGKPIDFTKLYRTLSRYLL